MRADPDSERTTAVAIGPPDPLRTIAAGASGLWVVDGAGQVILADPARPADQEVVKVGGELLDVEPEGDGAWVMDAGGGGTGRALRVAG